MADITITATSVIPTASAKTKRVTAGAAVTAGQAVYYDATDQEHKPADASTAIKANVAGIALHAASDGQPLIIAYGGDVALDGLTAGVCVMLSATADGGNLAPDGDLVTGNYITLIGVPTATNNLRLAIAATGEQVA